MNTPAPTLHFFVGKPAAGKTTLARRIAADSGAILFCEDEWLTLLEVEIDSVQDFFKHVARLRKAVAPVVIGVLRHGVSVVLDFPCNTVKSRAWARSLFEAAGAAHVLHFVDVSDDLCRVQLTRRNETRPEGVYWGHVPQERVDQVMPYFQPPTPDEGFTIVRHGPSA